MKKTLTLALCIWSLGFVLEAQTAKKKSAKPNSTAAPITAGTIRNGSFQDGTNFWSFQAKGEFPFSLSDSVPAGVTGKSLRYQRAGADSTNNFFFFQPVRIKPQVFYRLAFRYKGDGKLAPMVLLRELGNKGTPRRMFRLTASPEWQSYEVEFSYGKTDEVFRLEFYPGSAPNSYVREGGNPNAGRPGEFYFAGISFTETARTNAAPPPAGPNQVKTEKVIFKKTDTVDLAAYVDVPVGGQGPFPVVVMVHGGGWTVGSPEDLAWSAKFMVERGIACVRVQYRLIKDGGTFLKSISDVMDCIEWVRQNAKKYDFDLTRFGLTGGSAGGHLSSIAAQRTPECNVYMGYCGLYDAYEVGEGRFGRGAAKYLGPTAEDRKQASAIYQIKTPPPATILFHGMADATIDYQQAVRFAAALEKKGARTELLLNPGGGHDIGNAESNNHKLLEFLNREWKLDMKY